MELVFLRGFINIKIQIIPNQICMWEVQKGLLGLSLNFSLGKVLQFGSFCLKKVFKSLKSDSYMA